MFSLPGLLHFMRFGFGPLEGETKSLDLLWPIHSGIECLVSSGFAFTQTPQMGETETLPRAKSSSQYANIPNEAFTRFLGCV